MKNKKKKKPQQVELVQYQKPEIYHLVEESDLGGHEHLGGLHGHHGLGGLGGHGLHKKKYGRSIGGLFVRDCGNTAILFGFGFLQILFSHRWIEC